MDSGNSLPPLDFLVGVESWTDSARAQVRRAIHAHNEYYATESNRFRHRFRDSTQRSYYDVFKYESAGDLASDLRDRQDGWLLSDSVLKKFDKIKPQVFLQAWQNFRTWFLSQYFDLGAEHELGDVLETCVENLAEPKIAGSSDVLFYMHPLLFAALRDTYPDKVDRSMDKFYRTFEWISDFGWESEIYDPIAKGEEFLTVLHGVIGALRTKSYQGNSSPIETNKIGYLGLLPEVFKVVYTISVDVNLPQEAIEFLRNVPALALEMRGSEKKFKFECAKRFELLRRITSETDRDGRIYVEREMLQEDLRLWENDYHFISGSHEQDESPKNRYGLWVSVNLLRTKVWEQPLIASPQTNSLYEQAIVAGVPEEAIERNYDLWNFLNEIEKCDVLSANRVFYAKDQAHQKEWVLKFTTDAKKAKLSAALNALAAEIPHVVDGVESTPRECGGVYLTIQERKMGRENVRLPIEYWIAGLAQFHREGERVVREHAKLIIDHDVPYRPIEHYAQKHEQTRNATGLKFDAQAAGDDLEYLRARNLFPSLIHGDIKPENLLSYISRNQTQEQYLIDLEHCIINDNPGIDLAPLLMMYNVPEEMWDHYLRMYLHCRGFSSSEEDALASLREGTQRAKAISRQREAMGLVQRDMDAHGKLTPAAEQRVVVLRGYESTQRNAKFSLFAA